MDLHRSSISLLIISILSPVTLSMRYEILSGHTKCISEEIHKNAMSVGKYSIVNPNEDHPLPASHKITVRVTSPQGTAYHEADGVDSGQFSFTAVETGDYISCFSAVDHKPETMLTIDFDWRTGIHTRDRSNVAKKSQVEVSFLDKVLNVVKSGIHTRDSSNVAKKSQVEVNFLDKVLNLVKSGIHTRDSSNVAKKSQVEVSFPDKVLNLVKSGIHTRDSSNVTKKSQVEVNFLDKVLNLVKSGIHTRDWSNVAKKSQVEVSFLDKVLNLVKRLMVL